MAPTRGAARLTACPQAERRRPPRKQKKAAPIRCGDDPFADGPCSRAKPLARALPDCWPDGAERCLPPRHLPRHRPAQSGASRLRSMRRQKHRPAGTLPQPWRQAVAGVRRPYRLRARRATAETGGRQRVPPNFAAVVARLACDLHGRTRQPGCSLPSACSPMVTGRRVAPSETRKTPRLRELRGASFFFGRL